MSAGECNSLPSPGLVSSSLSSLTSDTSGAFEDPIEELPATGIYDRLWLSGLIPNAWDIHKLHETAHMALQSFDQDLQTAPSWDVQDLWVRPKSIVATEEIQSSAPQVFDERSQYPSPWLQRHPILGPVLGGDPLEGVQSDEHHTSHTDPRSSPGGRSSRSPMRSPSAKGFLKDSESVGEGVRVVDEEILKLLNELLKGQKEVLQKEAATLPAGAADAAVQAQRAADAAEEAAKLAKGAMKATRKQQLSVSTFMALGVQDDRLLLLDCFLAWNQVRREVAAPKVRTKEAIAQACSDDERPSLLHVENLQVPLRIPAGNGLVPPILPGHTLRALLGEKVFLDEDGSIRGASLLLSMRPPRATRQFLQSFDICLPWAEVQQDFGHRPLQEASIQTSPRGDEEPKAGFAPTKEKDDLTPDEVLRCISNLQAEMTDMEVSLDQLRQDLEAEPEEAADVEGNHGSHLPESGAPTGPTGAFSSKVLQLPRPPAKRLSRLRQRLPESLSWLEEAARNGRRGAWKSSMSGRSALGR